MKELSREKTISTNRILHDYIIDVFCCFSKFGRWRSSAAAGDTGRSSGGRRPRICLCARRKSRKPRSEPRPSHHTHGRDAARRTFTIPGSSHYVTVRRPPFYSVSWVPGPRRTASARLAPGQRPAYRCRPARPQSFLK